MATNSDQAKVYNFRLSFGNTISEPGKDVPKLVLEQGVRQGFKDSVREYYLTLGGVKVSRKIYEPLKIEVELTFEQKRDSNDSQNFIPQAPDASDVTNLLLRRMARLDMVEVDRAVDTTSVLDYKDEFNIAKNCFVYEVNPQLKRNNNGKQMFVKLYIFSMDKLMTLNKYSKAYVARKLGSEILQPESLQFGISAAETPLVQTDCGGQQFLMYKDGSATREFIQPYLVQYNESFYDFLVRTSNRCGEFLYFEDGKLTLGLPKLQEKDKDGKAVEPLLLQGYETVTMQSISSDPLMIKGYARDSVKDGEGNVSDLNQTVIKKGKTGFPTEAFPSQLSSNCEQAVDEYIFPLFKDKFSTTNREMFLSGDAADCVMFQAFKAGKTLFSNEITDPTGGFLASTVGKAIIVDQGVQRLLSSMQKNNFNKDKENVFLTPYKGKTEQSNDSKVVQFSSLSSAGWIKLSYYNDIYQYEEAQQRKIVCVNMSTTFAPVKLGGKVKIDGLQGEYVVIQIQQTSEEAWSRDYEKYGRKESDKFTGSRSLKIYCIPSFKKDEKDTEDHFVPPVQPVPVIRKSGPQTAFVTANEDPKFQGRVRIAYPWQSESSGKKAEVQNADQNLKAIETKLEDIKARQKKASDLKLFYLNQAQEIKKYVNASDEERKQMIEAKTGDNETKKDELAKLEDEIKTKQTEYTKCEDSLLDGNLSADDSEKTQNRMLVLDEELQRKKADRDIKNTQLENNIQLIPDMIAAAKEHDARNGKDQTYKDLEKHNSVIKKYMDASAVQNTKYRETLADETRLKKDKEVATAELTQKVAEYKASIQDMSSPWVRIATPMATPGGGSFYRPRIGDEVLVNFDCDNVERPYVVGSLFSKNVLTPDERYYRKQSPELQWKDVSMAISSPNGHHISFTDPAEGGSFVTNMISPGLGFYGGVFGFNKFASGGKDLAGGIHIGDRYGLYEIEMKSHKRSIEIKSPLGTVSINAFTGITISAPNGDVTIKGKNITLTAGNKVTINSGTNLPTPGFGDAPSRGTWWNDIGKLIVGGVEGAITDMFVTPVVDLSMIRHIIEVFVRPVDGTMLVKSRKFLRLEAGLGNAAIKYDQYKDKTKDKKLVERNFYMSLNETVTSMNNALARYRDDYGVLWGNFLAGRETFISTMNLALKDGVQIPDIAKQTIDKKGDLEITPEMFEDKFKESFELNGITYDNPQSQFEAIKGDVESYSIRVWNLIHSLDPEKMVESFAHVADHVNEQFEWIKNAVENTIKTGWVSEQVKAWKDILSEEVKNVASDYNFNVERRENPFAEIRFKFFRRATLLVLLRKVYDAPENKKEVDNNSKIGKAIAFVNKKFDNTYKYFYIGYEIADVTNQDNLDLDNSYWWKRQIDIIDRWNQNSWGRLIWDNLFGKLISSTVENTAGMWMKETDRQVWNSDLNGRILFSDTENSTIGFSDEQLDVEHSENEYNLAHLKWLLRDM